MFETKIKKEGLVDKQNISNLVKNSDFNSRKFTRLTTKAELNVQQDGIVKLQGV